MRVVANETRIFTVAPTGDPSGIDLLVSGKFGHHNGTAWGFATKAGEGVMKISGVNEIGSLTVNTGKLILENSGIAGMGNGGLVNSAQTEFSVTAGNTVNLGLSPQGDGNYAKTGSGTLNLQGFTGAPNATISSGMLHLTGGHNNYWPVKNTTVSAGAALSNNTHSHIKQLTLDGGELAATGADATWGSWMLDQTVTVTGSGTSVISAQRVAIANASNVSRIFDVAAAATLDVTGTFEDANTTTANGLTKTGSGTMILSAANTYTGPTAVIQGTLHVNGSTASAISVADTATLGGTGAISGAVTINNGGTLAPGNSVGTLTAGLVAINGKLAIEIDGSSADRLNVTGNLNITNATLALTGTPTGPEVIIASFGSLTGSAFATITGLPSGYHVTYDLPNKQIKLTAVSTGFAGWIGTTGVSNPAADADPDFDGIPNVIEYILGGDPSQPDSTLVPKASIISANLVFAFDRVDSSETSDITLLVEAGTTLSSWPETFIIGATSSPGVVIQENEAAPDRITVTIPQGGAPAKFARLRAIVSP